MRKWDNMRYRQEREQAAWKRRISGKRKGKEGRRNGCLNEKRETKKKRKGRGGRI